MQLVRMTLAGISRKNLVPVALLAAIVLMAAVAVYHSLDSWYLQTANATRLRADYSEIAATRFSEQASAALKAHAGNPQADMRAYQPALARLFDSTRLLPFGVIAPGGNAASFAMEVTDPNGVVVYRSGNPDEQPFVARDTIDAGGLVVSVAARKSAVAWIATEHLASRMMIILWLIILTAVAAVLAVRLVRREQRLAEARTGFVSSVSHELRTPLAQIQIFLETLRLGRFRTDAEREWTLAGMQREVTRLTTLVNNVLRFSVAERSVGRDPVHRRPVNVASFLHEVVDGFRPLAAAHNVDVVIDASSGVEASIDPDAMRQVILNLLDNAVKYGPRGQTIQLKASDAGNVVRISITDQGYGVPEADRPRIWDAFVRGSNVKDTSVAGSGIGLSVVRDIVEAHGGTAYVDPQTAHGATFVVELPRES
jgi:signal transduction histidine kinase